MAGENKIDMMFGKYRAIKEIGRGATSVVYLAEEDDGKPRSEGAEAEDAFPTLETGEGPVRPRYVAIKVVDFTDDRSKLSRRFRKLFATEAALTAQFDHPNIAKVYEWTVEDERAFLVMEYVEGTGLDQFVTMDKLLPMHKVVGIIFKLAMALDYAHRRGIVHRDIKPANVLLSKDDEVKLMDFGLALNIKKNVNVDSTFINGLGSPSYMSPEQIKGYTLNHQTDLYSLGVMFYQMLTGRLPFRAPNTAALVYKIINTEAVAVTQLNPDIPDLSDKVIKRSLEKDLYSRYRLGADMAKDLSAVRYQILDDKYIPPDDTRWNTLRGLPILGALDDVDVWELLRLSAWRVLQPATVLMTEGEEGKSFGFILEGEVEIEKGERAIAKLGRGEIVGEIAYLDTEGGTRSATVTALSKVTYIEINPAAFAFATEELREEIHRIATNAMVKRLRTATSLAKRSSPLAVHPASVTEADVEIQSAPVTPDKALGWGAFARVAAAITEAPVQPSATPIAPAAPPEPARQPAGEAITASANKTTTTRSTVVVQPLPAAAAAMIAQMALGGQVMGKAAPVLQPFELGPETADPPPPVHVSQLPAGATATTELGAHFGHPPSHNATTEMAANFGMPPMASTNELAPQFDIRAPMATTDMAADFNRSQQISTTDLAPRFDRSQQISTSELAPQFDRSQQISTTDLAPSFDRSQQISTTDLAPRFDRSQQISTTDLAPNFEASQQISTSDLAPRFDGNPLLTTEMAARFDAPPPMEPPAMLPPIGAGPRPAPARPQVPQKPLRPPVREVIQDSTQALASHIMSGLPPAYPGAHAGKAEPAFDMDKTVELSGGFKTEENDEPEADDMFGGDLFPPIESSQVAPVAASSSADAPRDGAPKAVPPAGFKPGSAAAGKATPPPVLRPTPPPVATAKSAAQNSMPKPAPAAAAPYKPAQPPVFKPTPPGASGKSGPKHDAHELQPEDFDKTVILTGGFEAQPPEEDVPPFDDLLPPIKF